MPLYFMAILYATMHGSTDLYHRCGVQLIRWKKFILIISQWDNIKRSVV